MRLPIRKSERLKLPQNDGPAYLTKEGLEKLMHKLKRLEEQELPQAIEDVKITAEFGDFSENAEYQEAKARMRRLHQHIFQLKERIKQVKIIEPDQSLTNTVQLGSTVELRQNGTTKIYSIVGPHEADPGGGRISYLSPLGSALLGHKVGEIVSGFTIEHVQI